MLYFSLSFFQ